MTSAVQVSAGGEPAERCTVVVAATFTAEPLADVVDFWSAELNLPVDIRFADYGQVFQQLLDPASLMAQNTSGLNVLAVRLEDWDPGSYGTATTDDLMTKVDDFATVVASAAERARVPLLVAICPPPSARDESSRHEHLRTDLADRLAEIRGVQVLAADRLLKTYQLETYDDPGIVAHGHVPYRPAFFAALGTEIVRNLRAAEAPPFKVLALDCDGTLWNGVVGEDGPLGVVVDAPRRAVQEFALAQREAGMLLCLCSKNAEEDVIAALEHHPDMLLRPNHFAATRINWNAKSENLRSLARELNVGVDSFVFLDDNPVECGEVSARCPEAVVVGLPDQATRIPGFLANVWAFDRLGRTQEDSQRARFYEQSTAREGLRSASVTFAEFISSLRLEVRIFATGPENLPRIAQLTQRTNQFNNTTIRRTEQQVAQALSSGAECLAVEVRDRFGDYGLVGVVLSSSRDDAMELETLLMSCRALGRGVEHRVLAHVGEAALARGLSVVRIPFVATAKNQPLFDFLRNVGARPVEERGDTTRFELNARQAAAVSFDPGRAHDVSPAPGNEDAVPLTPGPGSAFRLDPERFAHIAATAHTAEQISAQIATSARRQRPEGPTAYVAPRTPMETTLADLWAEALHLDRVGVFDDFFALGGSSLQATVLVNRLQATLDRSFRSVLVFEAPSVAGFAELLERQADEVNETPPIVPVDGPRRGPLSSAQERLWFLDQFNPGSTVYNERRAIRLRGTLSVDALEGALNDLVGRHESLRTTFPVTDGSADQTISPPAFTPLAIRDLSDLPAPERAPAATALLADEVARPFDLEHGPLFRAGLVRLDEHDHVLWFVFHHIVADGWSVGILVREAAALYRARLGVGTPLAPLDIQYLDFTSWQRQWLRTADLEDQRNHWRDRLASPPVLEVAADRSRPPIITYRGSSVPVTVPPELVAKLRGVGHRQHATLFMTLVAAFHVLLARHSGQDDIVVGFPMANRNEPEIEGLIGFFVNTLALRADLSGNPRFEDVLSQVRERAIEAYADKDVPFEQLVEDLVPQRDLSRTPIFQAMLALFDDPLRGVDLPNITASPVDVPVSTTRFELLLNLEEGADGLRGALEFSTDIFDHDTARRLVGHLLVLLEAIAEDPSRTILEMPLLTQSELTEVAGNSAAPSTHFDVRTTLHERFEAQVALTPDAAAVVCDGQALSYHELNARANRLAHRLQRLGVGPDVLVGLCADRSTDLVVGILGILKAGGAYLPLDSAYPAERLGFLLEDSGVRVLVAQERKLAALPAHSATVVPLDGDSLRSRARARTIQTAAPRRRPSVT